MAEIMIMKSYGNWVEGRSGEYGFAVKCFDRPSEYGIEQDGEPGRISKLWIDRPKTYGCVACYDRGWDKLPRTDEEIEATQAVIDRFN